MIIFQSHLDLNYWSIIADILFVSVVIGMLIIGLKKKFKKLFLAFSFLMTLMFLTIINNLIYVYDENSHIKKVIKDKTYFITEGNITNLYLPKKSTRNRAHFKVNNINFIMSYIGDFPEKHGLFYAFDNEIQKNNQKVKIFYIQIDDSFNLCFPFLSHCIEFNKPIKNKIIKIWVKN